MTQPLKAPIAISFRSADLARVTSYVSALSADPRFAVRSESQRLRGYLEALSPLLKNQLAGNPDGHKVFAPHVDAQTLVSPARLRDVFRTVAGTSRNVILSEMMILSDTVLKTTDIVDWYSVFDDDVTHRDQIMKLGFMQAFGSAADGQGASVSVPFFAFAGSMLADIYDHQPQRMLEAFQVVMTAGNHDMLHQYSNLLINSKITQRSEVFEDLKVNAPMSMWAYKQFSGPEADARSYESWLMLAHARVRARMPSAEQQVLTTACETFFDELSRMAPAMTNDKTDERATNARAAIDYFGTALCFALMRFVPFDHTLMQAALVRMESLAQEHALPPPQLSDYQRFEARQVLSAYAGKGLAPTGYAADKLSELIIIAPWVARLMSPAEDMHISRARARADQLVLDMVALAAESSGMLPDGAYAYPMLDGGKRICRYKNGKLDGGDLPAVEEIGQTGSLYQVWCTAGIVSRVNGPAVIDRDVNGKTTLGYYLNGRAYQASADDLQRWAAVQPKQLGAVGLHSGQGIK